MHHRSLLTGLAAAMCVPAIVQAGSIMPVRRVPLVVQPGGLIRLSDPPVHRALAWSERCAALVEEFLNNLPDPPGSRSISYAVNAEGWIAPTPG